MRLLLHDNEPDQPFDNKRIWAGNMTIDIPGAKPHRAMTRVFLNTDANQITSAIVSVELFVAGVTEKGGLAPEHVDARLWLDFNEHGYQDERGVHHPPLPRFEQLSILMDEHGRPVVRNGNQVFTSAELPIEKTGVFHYTAAFSADDLSPVDPAKQWIAVNDISDNRDGMLVVSPASVVQCPSITEVCLRKYGARVRDGVFRSGSIRALTDDLENITTEIIYLLPFFMPGTGDIFTGEDVRKGALGSIYAVKSFFRIDPELVAPPEEADIPGLISLGLIVDQDLAELLTGEQHAQFPTVGDLAQPDTDVLIDSLGRDTLVQLIGRAEMRWLARKAHSLGKLVIFDLVLMQTSRDCPLIQQHPDWYEQDENGHPKKHKIAWLDYSDVALFKLKFNKPLQNYLSAVAPFWIKTCELDGVRIDASQTVDRPFLKQIKNRINEVKSDAIVLGETLCAMNEAVDVPVDMIYTLLVDHHVHIPSATAYFDLFEEIHATFAPGTVGMAYFENHDSTRATFSWHQKFHDIISNDPDLLKYWEHQAETACNGNAPESPWNVAYFPALLRNIQCSVINAAAGSGSGVRFAYALEMGTDYGEEQRTDFEQDTLLYPHLRGNPPHSLLHAAYLSLAGVLKQHPVLRTGRVYYLRNHNQGADATDHLMAWVKYSGDAVYVAACNHDPASEHHGRYMLDFLTIDSKRDYSIEPLLDTYELLHAAGRLSLRRNIPGGELAHSGLPLLLPPLGAVIIKIV